MSWNNCTAAVFLTSWHISAPVASGWSENHRQRRRTSVCSPLLLKWSWVAEIALRFGARRVYRQSTKARRPGSSAIALACTSLLTLRRKNSNFFRSMCDENYSIKFARVNRVVLKQFLQDRYSNFVGERILSFLENEFVPLLRIDFTGWCQMLMDLLNAGP